MGLSVAARASARHSIFLALSLVISVLSRADSASAVPLSAREVRLKTYSGTPCILGVKVAYPSLRGVSTVRVRVEVLEQGVWRRAKRDPVLRGKATKQGRVVFHQPTTKRIFRYFLADRSGKRFSRPTVVRLSGLPLCPGVRDVDVQSLGEQGKGGVPPVATPTNPVANGDSQPEAECTRERLAKVWGTADLACDKNRDGVVDATDVALILGTTSSDEPPLCPSVDQLLASWGGSGLCDLDRSGVIDSTDLGILLASMQ